MALFGKNKKVQEDEDEHRLTTEDLLNSLSTTRVTIDPNYLKADAEKTLKAYLQAIYTGDTSVLLFNKMTDECYQKTINTLEKDKKNGITKTLYEIDIKKVRPTNVDNTMMYMVSSVEFEIHYTVSYGISHSTFDKKMTEELKMRYEFVSSNNDPRKNGWLLNRESDKRKIHSEEFDENEFYKRKEQERMQELAQRYPQGNFYQQQSGGGYNQNMQGNYPQSSNGYNPNMQGNYPQSNSGYNQNMQGNYPQSNSGYNQNMQGNYPQSNSGYNPNMQGNYPQSGYNNFNPQQGYQQPQGQQSNYPQNNNGYNPNIQGGYPQNGYNNFNPQQGYQQPQGQQGNYPQNNNGYNPNMQGGYPQNGYNNFNPQQGYQQPQGQQSNNYPQNNAFNPNMQTKQDEKDVISLANETIEEVSTQEPKTIVDIPLKTKQDKEKLASVNDFIKEIEVTPQTTIKENVPNNKEQSNDSSNIINKEETKPDKDGFINVSIKEDNKDVNNEVSSNIEPNEQVDNCESIVDNPKQDDINNAENTLENTLENKEPTQNDISSSDSNNQIQTNNVSIESPSQEQDTTKSCEQNMENDSEISTIETTNNQQNEISFNTTNIEVQSNDNVSSNENIETNETLNDTMLSDTSSDEKVVSNNEIEDINNQQVVEEISHTNEETIDTKNNDTKQKRRNKRKSLEELKAEDDGLDNLETI